MASMLEEEPPLKENANLNAYRRVKTPTFIQIEATECGAISLAIILAYYGKYVPVEQLRVACNVSRDGSSAWNIIEAAKSYGLEANGSQFEPEDLPAASLPAIIFWEYEHFVVLEGYGKDKYYVNDPATGPRIVSAEEFNQSFSGLLLELSPTEGFVTSGSPITLFKLLAKELKTIKLPLFFIFLTTFALLIPELAFPAFSQAFIDRILSNRDFSWVSAIVGGMALMIFVKCALIYLQERAFIYLGINLSIRLSCKALWHLLRLPIPFFSHRYSGELAQRTTLIGSIARILTGTLGIACADAFLVVTYGCVIFYYNVFLALIVFASALLNLLALRLIYTARQNDFIRYQAASGKEAGYAFNILEGIETIKSMGAEQQGFSKWAGHYTKSANAMQRIRNKDIYLEGFLSFLNGVKEVAIIAVGGILLIQGSITVGMFVALQMLIANFSQPIIRLSKFGQTIQMLKASLERLNDLMIYPIDRSFSLQTFSSEQADSRRDEYQKLRGEIEIRKVNYGYNPADQLLLQDIDMKIKPGVSIAIVGATGCGKSTLMALIAGLISPQLGEIFYDSIPSSQIQRHRLTNSLALVEQAPFIFQGSIKDNISLLNPLAKEEDIVKAAKDACIHDEIMSKKGGYDYLLENNGTNLSGGNKQRIEIARGLLKNPSILMLDECTSALDPETEAQLMSNIHRRGCTVLMIAHRLSSIKHCNEIYVMDKGRIVDVGTHEQLKSSSKLYKQLIEAEERTLHGD